MVVMWLWQMVAANMKQSHRAKYSLYNSLCALIFIQTLYIWKYTTRISFQSDLNMAMCKVAIKTEILNN